MARSLSPDGFGPVFDADNHYWETSDTFTRHRDPKFRDRGIQLKEIDGALRYVIGGKVFETIPGPADIHNRPEPGAFLGLFAGRVKANEFVEAFDVPPSTRPEWYNRDKRLEVMDRQGLEASWLFPSQGVTIEPTMLNDDIEAGIECIRAFNRWLDDDWGFAYKDRIFSAPYMAMSDPDKLVQELRWALGRGARVINVPGGPVLTRDGLRSPAHPMFDRFWGLVQEAGIVVASHGGATIAQGQNVALLRTMYGEQPDGSDMPPTARSSMTGSPIQAMTKGRTIHDFAFMLVAHRLFERFPGLRVAYIENGADWVLPLLKALEHLDHGGGYKENPRDQFIDHCWVAPYPEDDVDELARKFPTDRILFGSDWPHGEGFAEPTDFFEILKNFPAEDQRRIMYENVRELTFA
jgi:predicted TIM-barrel fold metal-dependent hydrolase